MADLFDPLTLRGLTLPNRIGVSPMCQYSARDGHPTDWHLVHLGGLAQGGAGLVMTEATAVAPEGRISPQDLGLWQDSHVQPLARLAAFVRAQGAVPGIQLAHAGRKAGTEAPWKGGGVIPPDQGGWQGVGPGPEPFAAGWNPPRALDEAGLRQVVEAFRAAAARAQAAGFQVLEVHSAHGYLLHQFLSPLSNRRQDAGAARSRTAPAWCARWRRGAAVWPEQLPVLVRLSATDWVPGGWDPDSRWNWPGSWVPWGWTWWIAPPGATCPRPPSPWPPATRCPSPPGSVGRRACPPRRWASSPARPGPADPGGGLGGPGIPGPGTAAQPPLAPGGGPGPGRAGALAGPVRPGRRGAGAGPTGLLIFPGLVADVRVHPAPPGLGLEGRVLQPSQEVPHALAPAGAGGAPGGVNGSRSAGASSRHSWTRVSCCW